MPHEQRQRLMANEHKNPVAAHKKMELARDRGNQIDRWAKRFMLGLPAGNVGPYHQWRDRLRPELVRIKRWEKGNTQTDLVVHSLDDGFAGTLDILCNYPSYGLTVLDIKTATYQIFPEAVHDAALQVAAYRLGLGLTLGIWAEAIASVHVSPYGCETFIYHEREIERLEAEFLQRCRKFGAAFSEYQAAT